jgi:para-aminobenzoate synthetase
MNADEGPAPFLAEMAAAHDRCFWLDGGGSRPWSGHRSIVGWLDESDVSLVYKSAEKAVYRTAEGRTEQVGTDIFDVLAAEMEGDGPDVHWVGYLGYACSPDLPARPSDDLPDAVWMRTRNVRIFEHDPAAHQTRHLDAPHLPPRDATAATSSVPAAYRRAFEKVQEELRAGTSYEVNLTYRLAVESDLDPVSAYLRLRELNPAPYAGFLQHQGTWLLSSSPERYAVIDRHRTIETKPIKGTTQRGSTAEEDAALKEQLATDPKFRAENLMIVDLLRNDLGMVCEAGSVEVPVLMDVESYPSVHQLVSTVRGRLRPEVSTIDALRSLFPAGSMTGAPKLRTMQIIDAVEETPRGVYSGAFGWISGDGRADLGVVIRSLMTTGDGTWTLGTGGGITVRSDCAEEYAESQWKADRLLRVLRDEGQPVRG